MNNSYFLNLHTSDGGGVFDDLDHMNGHTLCGCSTVSACQAGAPFGRCKATASPITSPSTNDNSGSFSGSVQLTGDTSSIGVNGGFVFRFETFFIVIFSLLLGTLS